MGGQFEFQNKLCRRPDRKGYTKDTTALEHFEFQNKFAENRKNIRDTTESIQPSVLT